MSEARASASLAELDALADRLYQVKPDEFSAAREAEIRKARAEGNKALASELGKLRKPTLSAWLINLLWRDQRDVMEQLFELADELSQAQAEAAGPALRALMAQRREIENALMRRAAALAQEAGVRVNETVVREAQETLTAALAVPEVADEVRSGRLTKAASYAGFGVLPSGAAVSRPRPERAPEKSREKGPQPPAEPIDLHEAQRAREERQAAAARRAAAQEHVEEGRAALTTATEELREQARAADAARRRHLELRQRLDDLRAQLRDLEAEVAAAQEDAEKTARDRDRAGKVQEAAQRELDGAEAALRALKP